MGSFFQTLLTYILLYKYVAIFLMLFLDALAVPIPAGSAFIASAFFASQGYLNFTYVFLAGLLGNVLGDGACYWLARICGKPLLRKIGLSRLIENSRFVRLETRLAAHEITTVFTSRFVLTPVVNLIAGLAEMKFGVFFIVCVIGEAIDVSLMALIGFMFGRDWEYMGRILGNFELISTVLVVLAILVVWRGYARKSARRHKA